MISHLNLIEYGTTWMSVLLVAKAANQVVDDETGRWPDRDSHCHAERQLNFRLNWMESSSWDWAAVATYRNPVFSSLSLSPFRLFSYLLGEFVFIYIPPGDVLRIAGRGRDVCVRVSRYALNYCPLTNMGARDRKSNRSRSKIDYEMMEEDGTRVRITTVNVANNQNSD